MIARRLSTLAMLATPALSFGTLAVALGVGANDETLAAVVYGAAPGADRAGLAWQVDVMLEDRGVREIKPNLPIFVHAAWKDEARDWSGVTTHEGAAEIFFDFPGVASGDDVDLVITTNDATKKILAHGPAHVPAATENRGNVSRATLTPIHREGDIDLDVAILGGALASEFSSEVWVHASDHQLHPRIDDQRDPGAIAGAHVQMLPTDGLSIASSDAVTDDDGWTKLDVTAQTLAAQTTIQLKYRGISSSWTGALPIVLGATRAAIASDDAGNLHVSVARPLVGQSDAYVEIDDAAGRVFAATVPLVASGNDFARGEVDVPKLSPGDYWIVSGSEPHAAETMPTGTFAIPFRVGEKIIQASSGELATRRARGFSRVSVLDGFLDAREASSRRRRRGMSIAFAALALGGIIETLLLLRAARTGSRTNDRSRSSDASWITKTPAAVAIGIGLSLLGFALLAAFVATH